MKKEEIKQYPLRLREGLKVEVDLLAIQNKRSTNAELNVLIEDGIRYRRLMQESGRITYKKLPFQEKDHAK